MDIETLQDQYTTVKKQTTKSPVLQWGQKTFTNEPISNFESGQDAKEVDFWSKMLYDGLNMIDDALMVEEDLAERKNTFAVDSRDIALHYYYNRVMSDPTPENHAALQAEINHRMKIDNIFETMFGEEFMNTVKSGETAMVQNFDCYRSMIETFEEECERLDDYSLKYAKAFVHECETNTYKLGLMSSLTKVKKACSNF